MSRKTNILVTQESQERYGNEAAADAIEILQNDDDFIDGVSKFDVARAKESAEMAHLQRVGNLNGNDMGTVVERNEEETYKSAARELSQPASDRVDQATGVVDTILGGGNGWGNDSGSPLAPSILGISMGSDEMTMQQTTAFEEGVH